HLLGEDVALEQELVVAGERVESALQRTGHGRDLRQLLRTEIVDVLVERLTGIDLALDAVDSGHQHGGEPEIRIAARIRWAELYALGLWRGRVHRNAAGRRTVAPRIRQVYRSFEAGNQALIRVGGRRNDGRERRPVLDQPADVPQRQLRQSRITVAREERLAVLPQ